MCIRDSTSMQKAAMDRRRNNFPFSKESVQLVFTAKRLHNSAGGRVLAHPRKKGAQVVTNPERVPQSRFPVLCNRFAVKAARLLLIEDREAISPPVLSSIPCCAP